MELLPKGAKIYRCHDYDRHKICVEHPNAKEISRKQAEKVEQLINHFAKNKDEKIE